MRGRKNLTERERYYLEKQLKKKESITQISKDLDCSRQTIYNEIKRGTVWQTDGTRDFQAYAYDSGQRIHEERSKNKGCKRKLSKDNKYLRDLATWILERKYSPYAASCKCGTQLCVKSIYNYIHAGLIEKVRENNLPYAIKARKKKHKKGKQKWNKGTSIELRPKEIEDRKEYGHWEMDTVYSSKDDLHCLLVLTERMTREEITVRMKDRTADSTIAALNGIERKIGTPAFRDKFKSITCDNGVEFSKWQLIESCRRSNRPRTKVYFCHPYSSYERGTNENQNKMHRRWIPKGDDIGLWSNKEVSEINEWINNYPRKIFGGMSSNEYRESMQKG